MRDAWPATIDVAETVKTVAELYIEGDEVAQVDEMYEKTIEPDAGNRIAGLCPDCLEVVCECPPSVKKRKQPAKKAPTDEEMQRAINQIAEEMKKIPESVLGNAVAGRPIPKSGRGPSGRIRNIKMMSDEKLIGLWQTLNKENNDPEAMNRVAAELDDRGL